MRRGSGGFFKGQARWVSHTVTGKAAVSDSKSTRLRRLADALRPVSRGATADAVMTDERTDGAPTDTLDADTPKSVATPACESWNQRATPLDIKLRRKGRS